VTDLLVIVLFVITAELAQAALGGGGALPRDTEGVLAVSYGEVMDGGGALPAGTQAGDAGRGLSSTVKGPAVAVAAGARVSFHLALQLGYSVALGAAAAAAIGGVVRMPRNGVWKQKGAMHPPIPQLFFRLPSV
jgi:hypothetical protein